MLFKALLVNLTEHLHTGTCPFYQTLQDYSPKAKLDGLCDCSFTDTRGGDCFSARGLHFLLGALSPMEMSWRSWLDLEGGWEVTGALELDDPGSGPGMLLESRSGPLDPEARGWRFRSREGADQAVRRASHPWVSQA